MPPEIKVHLQHRVIAALEVKRIVPVDCLHNVERRQREILLAERHRLRVPRIDQLIVGVAICWRTLQRLAKTSLGSAKHRAI